MTAGALGEIAAFFGLLTALVLIAIVLLLNILARALVWWLWFVAAPVAMTLYGYFPGKRLRMVGDIPGPAMQQWCRWCRHPEFAWGAEPALVLPSLRTTLAGPALDGALTGLAATLTPP